MSIILAERKGFEPLVPCGTPLFESGQFNHSCTSPYLIQQLLYRTHFIMTGVLYLRIHPATPRRIRELT